MTGLNVGRTDQDVVALDLDFVDADRLVGRGAQRRSRRYIEDTTMEGALDLFPIQVTLRQRGIGVGADVIDGVNAAVDVVNTVEKS